MVKKTKKFMRREWHKYSKLGRRRLKKQKWNKPVGRHNKMREKKKGYPISVSIGYRTLKEERGTINGKLPVQINNLNSLDKIQKNEIAIIGGIGKRKKIEIAKKARERGIEIYNLNPKSFLRRVEIQNKKNKGDNKK